MTHDFAKKTRRRAAPTRKKARTKARAKSNVPGWVWLFTGTALGAFIMFLTYLSGLSDLHSNPSNSAAAAANKSQPMARKTSKNRQNPKPRFDFYQLLEESEVENITNTQAQNTVRQSTSRPQDNNKQHNSSNTQTKTNNQYLMQVGAFKQANDAERLRVELLMMNLSAHIEEFTKRNHERYYRVLVGPYPNTNTMRADRATLTKNNIDIWVITRKISG